MVLETASTPDEAIDILIENQTGGVNIHIGDGKIPIGYVCELTANFHYIGTWDDPIENTRPFWQIDYVLRRKNMFISPLTAGTQRDFYNPKIYLLLRIFSGETPWFRPWRYYKTISEEIEKIWGDINIDSTINIARSIYRGDTDVYLHLSFFLSGDKIGPYYQWVACPKTGDIAISFAEGENFAQYEDIHHFNLFDLLNSEPP
jgi:hypothetical protein